MAGECYVKTCDAPCQHRKGVTCGLEFVTVSKTGACEQFTYSPTFEGHKRILRQ